VLQTEEQEMDDLVDFGKRRKRGELRKKFLWDGGMGRGVSQGMWPMGAHSGKKGTKSQTEKGGRVEDVI